jgi:acyl-CoA thioesterase-1
MLFAMKTSAMIAARAALLLGTSVSLAGAPAADRDPPSVLLIGGTVTAQYAGAVRDLLGPRIHVDVLAVPAGKRDALAADIAARVPRYHVVYLALEPETAPESPVGAQAATAERSRAAAEVRELRQWLASLFSEPQHRRTKLIWATAVPVPDGLPGVLAARVEAGNEMLTNLAFTRRALLLDLHDYVRIRRADLQRPGSFLLNQTGIELVAAVVANRIEEVLLEGNEPGLPNLLVLGDSIAGQYSTFLREKLLHRANVRVGGTAYDAHPDWAAVVRREVTEREAEIGRSFDLIQFNWGLHALKWAQGTDYSMRFKEGYTRCVPLERYGAELEKLILELKRTGRRLVWATTTPPNNGSEPDDAIAYNAVALAIIQRHGIAVNDLHAFVVQHRLPQNEPRNCHFPRSSSERLGHRVAETLLELARQGTPGAVR